MWNIIAEEQEKLGEIVLRQDLVESRASEFYHQLAFKRALSFQISSGILNKRMNHLLIWVFVQPANTAVSLWPHSSPLKGRFALAATQVRQFNRVGVAKACTQTLLYCSSRSFRKHRRVRERVRTNVDIFFFPHPYILSRALDGLWRENRGSVNRRESLQQ